MIYGSLGNNTAGLEYKKDPLADTIAPDYKKLSMSAWGMPDLDKMDKFAPKMDENLDTVPQEFNDYVKGLSDVTATVQKFMKLGIDLTKPSLDPQENAAHLELMQQYNDVLALGKKLQQSRKIREAVQTAATKDVYTNPVSNELLTTEDPYVFKGDTSGLQKLVDSRSKNRDYYYSKSDEGQANSEIEQTLNAIDGWEAQQINNNPSFEKQVKAQADLARAQIKGARYDQYKNDKIDLEKQGLALKEKAINNTDAYHRGLLDMARKTFGWKQSQSAPIEFDTESLIRKAGTGDVQAIDLINKYIGVDDKGKKTSESLTVVKGSDLNNDKGYLTQPDGSAIKIDPNQNYFIRVDAHKKRYATPVNDISIKSYTQGMIGKALEAGTQENKTSNLWSEDETEISDTPINAKKTSTQSGNGGETVKKSNVITSKSKSGKDIYSDDGGKTWKYK